MERFKILEDNNYIYHYYEPLNEEDESKILQINKITKEKRWINLSDDEVWERLEKAKLVSSN